MAIGPSIPLGTGDVLVLFFLVFLETLGIAVGALVGALMHLLVSRTRLAGPADRRMVAGGLVLTAVLAALSGVRHVDFQYRPRVIRSNGTITRLAGPSVLVPLAPATRLYGRLHSTSVAPLTWRDRNVQVAIEDQTLVVVRAPEVVDRVSLKGLHEVEEVYVVTAALDAKRQWLALEVRLRYRGSRELLLIYDPAGTRAHQELLARTEKGPPRPMLWSAGQAGARQEFMLDLGEPVRYAAQK